MDFSGFRDFTLLANALISLARYFGKNWHLFRTLSKLNCVPKHKQALISFAMIRHFLGLSLMTLSHSLAFAQASAPQHLIYSPLCMSKYEYQSSTGGIAIVDYHLTQASGAKLIFRVFPLEYNRRDVELLPAAALECKDLKGFDASPSKQPPALVIAEALEKTGYRVWQVAEILVLEQEGQGLNLKTKDWSWVSNGSVDAKTNLAQGQNDKAEHERWAVFLNKKDQYACLNRWHFKLEHSSGSKQAETWIFEAKIGLVKIEAPNKQLSLLKVNGQNIEAFRASKCSASGELSQATPIPPRPNPNPTPVPSRPNNPFEGTAGTLPNQAKTNNDKPVNPMDLEELAKQSQGRTIVLEQPKQNTQEYRPNYPVELGQTGQSMKIHQVDEGECLFTLANRYQTTVETIKELNGLSSDALQYGQKLRIQPGLKLNMADRNPIVREEFGRRKTIHVIVQGDTIGKLAKRYQTSRANLENLNNLAPDAILFIGQEILIQEVSAY